jgi:hypothetical protein
MLGVLIGQVEMVLELVLVEMVSLLVWGEVDGVVSYERKHH